MMGVIITTVITSPLLTLLSINLLPAEIKATRERTIHF